MRTDHAALIKAAAAIAADLRAADEATQAAKPKPKG